MWLTLSEWGRGLFGPLGAAERRAEPRRPAEPRLLVLVARGREHGVRLRNLTSRGLMAEARIAMPPGEPVTVRCVAFAAAGEIVWAQGAVFGLRFDRPIAVPPELLSTVTGDLGRV